MRKSPAATAAAPAAAPAVGRPVTPLRAALVLRERVAHVHVLADHVQLLRQDAHLGHGATWGCVQPCARDVAMCTEQEPMGGGIKVAVEVQQAEHMALAISRRLLMDVRSNIDDWRKAA